jgi:hypothetical protein
MIIVAWKLFRESLERSSGDDENTLRHNKQHKKTGFLYLSRTKNGGLRLRLAGVLLSLRFSGDFSG